MAIFPTLPLQGKLLVDIGNWEAAIYSARSSLGETLQWALRETRMVKAMNFPSAQLMGHPEKLAARHTT